MKKLENWGIRKAHAAGVRLGQKQILMFMIRVVKENPSEVQEMDEEVLLFLERNLEMVKGKR